MPSKYVINTKTTTPRFEPVTPSGVIAWEEGCLKCAVCVKKMCVYGVYENRSLNVGQMIDTLDNRCMNCLRCVQNCPRELIQKSLNPEFLSLGDDHWTPETISRLWYQAETGKIPVSGAGYSGPFSGPGFDSMWTDMSEIVRPTRDGIHGREYISTAVDLGHTPDHLCFNDKGDLEGDVPFIVNIPLPIMLKLPPFGAMGRDTIKGWAMAAKRLGTLLTLPQDVIDPSLDGFGQWLVPTVYAEGIKERTLPEDVRVVELSWSDRWQKSVNDFKIMSPDLQVSVRIPMARGVEKKAVSLAEGGVSIIHLEGSRNGLFLDNPEQSLKDGIRSVHSSLLEKSVRDRITLLASGGLSMAEHVAKSLICGVDAVLIDFPILIALECRMCRRCTRDLPCPVDIQDAPSSWVASRTRNLIGAWHNQLLEMMGAMGIRDARRLRGEIGRAMFYEDLDRSTFESLGELKEGYELE